MNKTKMQVRKIRVNFTIDNQDKKDDSKNH